MKISILFLATLAFHLVAGTSAQACSLLPSLQLNLPKLSAEMNVLKALDQAWAIKNSVRTLMKKDYDSGALNRECSNQYKSFYIALRNYEDRAADLGARKGIATTNTAYSLNNPQLYVADGQTVHDLRTDLQSGDIVLSRGNAYSSSAISNLADSNTQFSHMSLVYKNPTTGKLYTIEAHIELGVIARPLSANIEEMNSRDMVFRFQDQELSHRAAAYMYNRAIKKEATGRTIDYDFAMDMSESKDLFCSEVVSHAFEQVSQGKTMIPMFKSSLTTRNLPFQKAIGVSEVDSFMPADLEIDPRFTMIAEWKDWKMVRDLNEKDAILRSMLSWMDTKGYQFDQSWNLEVMYKKDLGWTLRRTPLLKGLVVKKLPLNMSRHLVGLFTVLDQVGKALQASLQEYTDRAIIKSGGLEPSEEWMIRALELIREKDAMSKKPTFHTRFYPAE